MCIRDRYYSSKAVRSAAGKPNTQKKNPSTKNNPRTHHVCSFNHSIGRPHSWPFEFFLWNSTTAVRVQYNSREKRSRQKSRQGDLNSSCSACPRSTALPLSQRQMFFVFVYRMFLSKKYLEFSVEVAISLSLDSFSILVQVLATHFLSSFRHKKYD